MKRLLILAASLVLLLAPGCSSTTPLSFFQRNLASFQSYSLDNGIQFVLKRTPGNHVVALTIGLKDRAMCLPPGEALIEEIVLAMLRRGSPTYPYGLLGSILYRLSSKISFSTSTGDYSSFSLSTFDKYFWKLYPVFLDCFLHPAWDKEHFSRVIKDLQVKHQAELNDPYRRMRFKLLETFFSDHPYNNPFNNVEQSLEKVSLQDAKDYFANTFVPERMIVVAVGDFPGDTLCTMLNETLGQIPKKGFSIPSVPPLPERTTSALLLEPFTGTGDVSYVRAALTAPDSADPDYPSFLLACAMLSDLMYETVRLEHGAAYGVRTFTNNYKRNFMFLDIYKTSVPEKVKGYIDNAIAILVNGECIGLNTPVDSTTADNQTPLAEMGDQMLEHVPIAEALGSYKARCINQFYGDQETNASIADQILSSIVYHNDYRNYLYMIDQTHSVTAGDVIRAAKKYLYDQPKLWMILGEQKNLDKVRADDYLGFLGTIKELR